MFTEHRFEGGYPVTPSQAGPGVCDVCAERFLGCDVQGHFSKLCSGFEVISDFQEPKNINLSPSFYCNQVLGSDRLFG